MNPVFSRDGKVLFFESWASDLLPNQSDFNGYGDIFAYEIHSSSDIPVFRAAMVPSAEGLWITWPTLPGKSYRVQFKVNLDDPEWQDSPGGATIVENQAWFKDSGSATERFFRVVGF
jgi:hypothetical protein